MESQLESQSRNIDELKQNIYNVLSNLQTIISHEQRQTIHEGTYKIFTMLQIMDGITWLTKIFLNCFESIFSVNILFTFFNFKQSYINDTNMRAYIN